MLTSNPEKTNNIAHKLKELWQYRELVYNLTVRDLKVRYKNSILGIVWSLANPLLMMAVYTVVFKLIGQADQPNYPAFILCALLPWNFFSSSVAQATDSVVAAAPLINKVYFPREVLPISVVLSNLVNFLIALPVFFLLAWIMGNPINLCAAMLPVIILVEISFILGITLITSTLNVFYRDTRHVLDVLLLAWFFLTPIFYPITIVREQQVVMGVTLNMQVWLRRLNPMASIIAAYRDMLYWGTLPGLDFLLRTALTAVTVLVIGYLFFLHYSPRFSEEV
jgi:ABC-type polysaccharide/polyol phosphate export permease